MQQQEALWRQRREASLEQLSSGWGHSKDHRPDLKQILYNLTDSADGAVPMHFFAGNGNLTDDQTHRSTWDLLRELKGTPDFLYVADSKLATKENMSYVDTEGGRFISVLPETRGESRDFRELVTEQAVSWPTASNDG